MKHKGLIVIFIFFASCQSDPSTVCDQIEPDQICMDYKTSPLGLQAWYKTGNCFVVHLANNNEENPFIPQLDLYFRLFDQVSDSVPQLGKYKPVSFINTSLSSKQVELDLFIDGKQDYILDLSVNSTFEIERITDMVLDGRSACNVKHEDQGSDKRSLNVNFQGVVKQ